MNSHLWLCAIDNSTININLYIFIIEFSQKWMCRRVLRVCRILLLTFVTSKAAAVAIETLKSLKEGLTVQHDTSPAVSTESFIKSHRKNTGTCLCVLSLLVCV